MRTLLLLLALLVSGSAVGGECRGALRPLLLQSHVDAGALEAVQALCQHEADAGDAQATYQLALARLGLNGRFEPETAIPMIRDAAGRGVSEAQYWLAWQYESGPLLMHDTAAALDWYRRAAERNHRLAIARLAEAYEHGELGLAADAGKALELRARESRCAKKEQAARGRS
jgi:TPR repeat protein